MVVAGISQGGFEDEADPQGVSPGPWRPGRGTAAAEAPPLPSSQSLRVRLLAVSALFTGQCWWHRAWHTGSRAGIQGVFIQVRSSLHPAQPPREGAAQDAGRSRGSNPTKVAALQTACLSCADGVGFSMYFHCLPRETHILWLPLSLLSRM